ncbi:MAG: transcriptional regulator [Halobacteriales archaeon]|nr:transcriptional regulator [Halobacteriales archaeon]
MTSSIEENEFLARSEHRVVALRTLRDGPSDRDELRTATEASSATIARLLNEFEDRNWVVRDGHEYALTDPGTFVADEFLRLVDRMETEVELRDVWQWFPTDLPGCTMSLFADAVITVPETSSPYQSLSRHVELVDSARTVRGFSSRPLKPESYELSLRNAVSGTDITSVYHPVVIDDMLRVAPEELLRDAIGSAHFTVLENDSLPTDAGLGLYDDRLAVWFRDDDGVVRGGVDTDAPEAVAWGESIYERARSEARPVDLLERLEQKA